jgi:hypothetical protein
VRIAPHIDLVGLADLFPETAVRVRAVDLHSARVGQRDENVLGRDVGGELYRAGRQGYRIVELRQGAGRRIDRQRGQEMITADKATAAGGTVAAPDIQPVPRGMRPAILHIRRQRDRTAPGQCTGRDVDRVMR